VTSMLWIGGLCTGLLLVYLGFALLHPERLS
jgi:K+-transporting ATPase KdpF subunit